MKLVSFTCPGCGAQLNVDADMKQATCQFCGMSFPVDDESQHVKFDGAEQAGYEFEKGRQRAQREQAGPQVVYVETQAASPEPKRKRRTWLWVLGWIFVFPVPLTIIMLTNESAKTKLNDKARYIIIGVAWLLYLILVFSSGGRGASSQPQEASSSSSSVSQVSSSVSSAVPDDSVSEDGIEVTAGEMGQYGKELVMSEGTDMEERLVVYYLPAGDYEVKNLGDKGAQVSVYEGVQSGDNGYDEYTGSGDMLVVRAGESGDITIPEGWFVEIAAPAHVVFSPKA